MYRAFVYVYTYIFIADIKSTTRASNVSFIKSITAAYKVDTTV